jgi:small subunit ribosomal protein S20
MQGFSGTGDASCDARALTGAFPRALESGRDSVLGSSTLMANSAQARKRARQGEQRRQHNAGLKSALRTAVKKVRKAIKSGDADAATQAFREAQPVIDRIADKKVVHKNKAARDKSRLTHAIKAMAKAPA